MWLAVAMAAFWGATEAPAEELLLHPARYMGGWAVDLGGEFPGATGSMGGGVTRVRL